MDTEDAWARVQKEGFAGAHCKMSRGGEVRGAVAEGDVQTLVEERLVEMVEQGRCSLDVNEGRRNGRAGQRGWLVDNGLLRWTSLEEACSNRGVGRS